MQFKEPRRSSETATLKCDKGEGLAGRIYILVKEINGLPVNITFRGPEAPRVLPAGEVEVAAVALSSGTRSSAVLKFNAERGMTYLLTLESEEEETRLAILNEQTGEQVVSELADTEIIKRRPWWLSLPPIIVF